MNSDIGRGLVHPRDAVLMKIVLLNAPMLESNLAVHGEAQPHDHGTFELRAHALGIDLRPAVESDVDPRDLDQARFIERALRDGGDVAQETIVGGKAMALLPSECSPPACLA